MQQTATHDHVRRNQDMKRSVVRKQWLAAAGLLLALALAIAGELLFDSTSSLALLLKPAGGLALAASLAAAILAAWLAPARSDAPGLSRPLPPPPPPIRPSRASPGSGHYPAEHRSDPVGRVDNRPGRRLAARVAASGGDRPGDRVRCRRSVSVCGQARASVDYWTASDGWLAGDLGGDGALWPIGRSP